MDRVREREIDPTAESYDSLRESFHWHVPEHYNIAHDICDRHAEHADRADRVALYYEDAAGNESQYTFRQLKILSNKLANVLSERGLTAGDRIAILLPQSLETIVAHVATYKLGAIAVPLTVLFRQDALLHRLGDSGCKAIVMAAESLSVVEPLLNQLPELTTIVVTGTESPPEIDGRRAISFRNATDAASDQFTPADTLADDPAIIIYTSGTTGNPKGALHAHRFLLGHLPAVELSHDFFPQEGDRFWTPADWAWIGGLINALFSSLHHAVPIVGCESRGRFDPEQAFALMEKYQVRNAFLPPTALRMMAQAPDVTTRYRLNLRSIMSGGESLGSQTLDWARDALGVRINEIYGQTEINLVIGNCAALWDVRPGSMGKTYPGHRLAVVDQMGLPLPTGEIGELAVRRGDDPVFFLGYWNNPEATEQKYVGNWALTGDLALQDEDGYFWFKGRKDDVIISAGYRIGPTEVENALLRHPAVAMAAVVASPDELRGHVVKAFIKLGAGHLPSDELAQDIQAFVKATLAMHEYPRKVEFIDELPLTSTGKVRRNALREREAPPT